VRVIRVSVICVRVICEYVIYVRVICVRLIFLRVMCVRVVICVRVHDFILALTSRHCCSCLRMCVCLCVCVCTPYFMCARKCMCHILQTDGTMQLAEESGKVVLGDEILDFSGTAGEYQPFKTHSVMQT